ncbi:MAG: GNAT family N-acetyltransferase [Gammaproteobacteria bacterium]|nr:GNAT family N-acetyltransferase [Gammaproteobacteria bacterium]
MARFKIIQSAPAIYKEQIIDFWNENLPGTPVERFEWMLENPAGSAIWFFAFEEEKNELVGTISIMTRQMFLNKKPLKAGIVGDYMVSKAYRVFGPALSMQKKVLESMSLYGFDYVYTIPNDASLKMNERAGYINAVKLLHFVKPINSSRYFYKYFNSKLSAYIGYVFDFVLRIFSKESYLFSNNQCDEVESANDSFDVLWAEVKNLEKGLIGDHSSDYINWRYFKNPISSFRLLTLRSRSEEKLLGYLVFSIVDDKVDIYDILTLKKSYKDKLLKKVIQLARCEKCQSIYIRLPEVSKDITNLRKFMFFNADNDMAVLVSGKEVSIFNQWLFTEGDRNI